jgi:hypothetical protein
MDELDKIHTKLEHLLTKYLTFSPTLVQQLSLSQKRGGFGLRRPSNFESAAKISSFRDKENSIEHFFPFLNDFDNKLTYYNEMIKNNNLQNEINIDINNNNNINDEMKDNIGNNKSKSIITPRIYTETMINYNYGLNCVSNINNYDCINKNNNKNILIINTSV